MVRVHLLAQGERVQQRGIVREVVVDEHEHHEPRAQAPRVLVVVRQLVDLPGASEPERRGGHLQVRQPPGGQGLEPDVHLVGDGYFLRFDEGIAEHGDVAARRGSIRAGRLTVQETPPVGSGYRPEVESVRIADLRARRPKEPDPGDEARWRVCRHERHGQPQPDLQDGGGQRQTGDEQRRIQAGQPQHAMDVRPHGSVSGAHPDQRQTSGRRSMCSSSASAAQRWPAAFQWPSLGHCASLTAAPWRRM